MSRSFKKNPVYKDPNNSEGKKKANRSLRRKVKHSIQKGDEVMPLLDEAMNAYDIVDFKIEGFTDNKKDLYKKLKRK